MNLRNMRQARLAAGLTFREVGTAAQLDPTAIAHYEVGRGRPSAGAVTRWHSALTGLLRNRSQAIAAALTTL